MICRKCNENIPSDSVFCPYCNEKIASGVSAETAKGYEYLAAGQWKNALSFFDFALEQEESAEAHIGRMLAEFKLRGLDELVTRPKKLIGNKDFAAALRLADGEYRAELEKYRGFSAGIAEKRRRKSRKRLKSAAVTAAAAVMLSAAAFFGIIPGVSYLIYEKLIFEGQVSRAAEAYSESDWFEFDGAVRKLFYQKGIGFIEKGSFENALKCFEVSGGAESEEVKRLFYEKGAELFAKKDFETAEGFFGFLKGGYRDSKKYADYCHAKLLWEKKDLEAYEYFTACGDFFDAGEILKTEESFVMLTSVQGDWKRTGKKKLKTQKREDDGNRIVLGPVSEASLNSMSPYRNIKSLSIYGSRFYLDKIKRISKSELVVSDSEGRWWHVKISGGKLLFQDTELSYVYEYTRMK